MAFVHPVRTFLRALGSLQVAVILLLLLMVAMGSATVHESAHGTTQAVSAFYGALWFRLLLALLGANLAAAVAARYPFRRQHVPFLLAHGGLLVILAGALTTALFGLDGQLTLTEGETAVALLTPGELVTLSRAGAEPATLDLSRSLSRGRGLLPVERPVTQGLSLDRVHARVLRFAPDVAWEHEIANDATYPRLALDVSLAGPGGLAAAWVFAGEPTELGGLQAELTQVDSPDTWRETLAADPDAAGGTVRVRHGADVFEFPLARCLSQLVPIGDTGFTLRVVRYLPHATVGSDRTLVNSSDKPVNPAIEAEIAGDGGSEKRIAFARFPDFHGRPSAGPAKDFILSFADAATTASAAPIELLAGPDRQLAVRLAGDDGRRVTQPLTLGQPQPTPWPGVSLTVRQRFDYARSQPKAVPQVPPRTERQPALFLALTIAGAEEEEFWLPKGTQRSFAVDGHTYGLLYADPTRPLGFSLTLDQFRIGYYPGGERPRSFESSVRFAAAASGREQSAVISMNQPAAHGGYTFYQSSYRKHGERMWSTLSISRDPGRPLVFAGYLATMLGTVLLLVRRFRRAGDAGPSRNPEPWSVGQEGAA